MTDDGILIRPAEKSDARQIAGLFIMAWPIEEFLAMDPSLTVEAFKDIVTGYVESEDTMYSYRRTMVAVAGDRIAGAVNGYDGALYKELKVQVSQDLKKRFPSSSDGFDKVVETEAGEYYLDSIGVDPAMRSCGIGSRLFKAIIAKAAEEGYRKIGLIVDIDKPKAEALYKRLGFETVGYRDFLGHSMKHMQITI